MLDPHVGLGPVISELARHWNAKESWVSWAGECGDFAHVVWERMREQGIEVAIDSLDNGLTSATPLADLPGISWDALEGMGVTSHLNHVWVVWRGRCYDAAHPAGVDNPVELRLVRQALVEALRLVAPTVAADLCHGHAWWQQSERLLDEFLMMVKAVAPSSSLHGPEGP